MSNRETKGRRSCDSHVPRRPTDGRKDDEERATAQRDSRLQLPQCAPATLRPGAVCAFIGEPGAGKSNLLFALRALLDPGFDLSTADVTDGERTISIEATLAGGGTVSLDDRAAGPPIVHFPTALRGSEPRLGAVGVGPADDVRALIREALARAPAPRVALVRGLEACARRPQASCSQSRSQSCSSLRRRIGISAG